MVISDLICSDADLQLRLGQDLIQRAAKNVLERDAIRQTALDKTVTAIAGRLVSPVPEASQTPALLKDPVTIKACALLMFRAFGTDGDAWEKRRQLLEAEWLSIVSGNAAATSGGGSGGGTTTPVVRAQLTSVRIGRR